MKNFIYKLKFMNRYKNKFDKKIKFLWLGLLCFSLFYFQTMVFSALNVSMEMSGDAYVRVDADIRVSSINLVGVENDAIELYSPSYSKNTIKTGIRLNSLDGVVNYKFIVSNIGTVDMEIGEITSTVDNNEYISYELIDYELGDKIAVGEVKEINIRFKYNSDVSSLPTNTIDEVVLELEFDRYGLPMLAAKDTWYKTTVKQNKIKSLTLHDTYEVPSNVLESWDATELSNGKVMAYLLDDYSLHLVGNGKGKIYANPDSSFAFSDELNPGAQYVYPFGYLTTIENFDMFDTSYVTNMYKMFQYFGGYNTGTMDLSFLKNMDTSNVTDMSYMFYSSCDGAKNSVTIDISNWDTSNVTDMSYMFYNFGKQAATLNLNLNGLDTSKVNTMFCMLRYAGNLASDWNVSGYGNFNTSSVTNLGYMFANVGTNDLNFTLEDFSNWNTNKLNYMHYIHPLK